MAQQMQDALLAHDRVKRSTDLPLFYGNPAKDTISAKHLMVRFEYAAEIANWNNDARKCRELYMILREDAITWWETLDDYGVDKGNYNDVKAQFLDKFEPKSSAKTSCANLMEMTQRPGETAYRFYLRLFKVYRRLCDSKPADMADVRLVPAVAAAATANEQQLIKKEGLADMEMFLKHQLFIAGLREPLRSEVMKAGKASLHESVDFAEELESIYRKEGKTVSAVIEDVEAEPEKEEEELTEEDLEAINLIRRRNGKPPFRGNFRRPTGASRPPTNGNNYNGSKPAVQCRYCKKSGHMQKECRSRRRDRAPMVDASGKPFAKQINAVDNDVANGVASVFIDEPGTNLNWS